MGEAINRHKLMAMGKEMGTGMKKGGSIKKAEGGSVSSAETYNGGSGVLREDMTGKRMKRKDGDSYEYENYKKGGKTPSKGKKK
jgi:hypothetical protein